jgi:hypothetical protein
MGLLIGLPTPEPCAIKVGPRALSGSEANDVDLPCPPVKLRTAHELIDGVTVSLLETGDRPYVVSYTRFNGTHYGSMCLDLKQLKQLIQKASALIGTIAVDLDELDDHNYIEENDEDE